MRDVFQRALRGLPLLVLGAALACVDPDGSGSLSGTSLYVFDAAKDATNRVLVWDGLDTKVDETTPAPTRQIRSDYFERVKDLAWGGMVVDEAAGRLYLVGRDGDVVRVDKVRSKNGTITDKLEVVGFTLGDNSSRLSGGRFEQASFDRTANRMYVMEVSDSASRVWVIASPNAVQDGGKVTPQYVPNGNDTDKGGCGVAAHSHLFAYFADGPAVIDPLQNRFQGPRIWRGSEAGLGGSGRVVVGGKTTLTAQDKVGVLAYNAANFRLYVGRHLQSSGATGAPILVYTNSEFNLGYDQAPAMTLGDASLNQIRILATTPGRDWLVAGTGTASGSGTEITQGGNTAYVWRNPAVTKTPLVFPLGAGVQARGMALDGSN